MLQRRDPSERRAAGLDKGARSAAWSCPMAALVAAARALCQDLVHALLHRRVKATNEVGHAMAVIYLVTKTVRSIAGRAGVSRCTPALGNMKPAFNRLPA